MAERKTLLEGLDSIEASERATEKQFVFGNKPQQVTSHAAATEASPDPQAGPTTKPAENTDNKPSVNPLTGIGRVPVGARLRTELATALKRASLERQLQGIEPNSLQDILEEAIAPWLRQHGYLK